MNPFYSPPEEPQEVDPNPGVKYVLYTPRGRLGELASIIASCKGRAVVPPQELNRFEWFLTAEIPYGRTQEFCEILYEEGIRKA